MKIHSIYIKKCIPYGPMNISAEENMFPFKHSSMTFQFANSCFRLVFPLVTFGVLTGFTL